MEDRKKISVSFNSPVVLTFTFLCFAVLILDNLSAGKTTISYFSVYRSSFFSPLTYLRLFTHVLGHANFAHFFGNITMFLVTGPLLEEKYGSENILFVILATALITALVNIIFFPSVRLLGASGVVFAFILLSSLTSSEERKIPLTFILVSIIYIGNQIYSALFIDDNISNLSHLLGGITGSVLGFTMNKYKMYKKN